MTRDEAGIARVVAAADGALGRLQVTAFSDPFPALGEVLFWIVALAEVRRRDREELILGLKWARNGIAHGELLAAPVDIDHGASLGYFRLGYTALGSGPSLLWRQRPVARARHGRDGQARAYDELIAGRAVVESLRGVLDDLR